MSVVGFKNLQSVLFVGATLTLASAAQAGPGPLPADSRYPYQGSQFRRWVQESYKLAPNGGKGIAPFTQVFEARARKSQTPPAVD